MSTEPFTNASQTYAVIGGSGLYEFPELKNPQEQMVHTPYGDVFGLLVGEIGDKKVVFQERHGTGHRLPPHKVNYRANIWALHALGVSTIFAVNAVGGIAKDAEPGALIVPDQIIDYTYDREQSYADLLTEEINHIDFTYPFTRSLRELIVNELGKNSEPWCGFGVYGCAQGPRLETAAEINKMERDGCSIVGMTAMPEAALARELKIDYASVCIVANWAAGRSSDLISLQDIHAILERSSKVARQLLAAVIAKI